VREYALEGWVLNGTLTAPNGEQINVTDMRVPSEVVDIIWETALEEVRKSKEAPND
jgi:hypothetical protein